MPFRCIGGGCCGSIWAVEDASETFVVLKCEDGNRGRSVQYDQTMHRRVIATDASNELPVRTPASYELIEEDDAWWKHHLHYLRWFPKGRVACRAYMQEHIPAVPAAIRKLLIARYCPEDIQAAAKASRENEDCLIRVYAGRRRRTGGPQSCFFILRNYGLHVDQMDELGLDSVTVTQVLADTLAHCY